MYNCTFLSKKMKKNVLKLNQWAIWFDVKLKFIIYNTLKVEFQQRFCCGNLRFEKWNIVTRQFIQNYPKPLSPKPQQFFYLTVYIKFLTWMGLEPWHSKLWVQNLARLPLSSLKLTNLSHVFQNGTMTGQSCTTTSFL